MNFISEEIEEIIKTLNYDCHNNRRIFFDNNLMTFMYDDIYDVATTMEFSFRKLLLLEKIEGQ
jgi:hypothetical protein